MTEEATEVPKCPACEGTGKSDEECCGICGGSGRDPAHPEDYEMLRRELEDKIVAQLQHLDYAQERFDRLDKERKDAKSALDTEHNVLVKLARDLRDLMTGEYQPSLPLTDGEPEGEEESNE